MMEIDEKLLSGVYREIYRAEGPKVLEDLFQIFRGSTVNFPLHMNDKTQAKLYVQTHPQQDAKNLASLLGYNVRTIRTWRKSGPDQPEV
ncbi:hypothetical protein LZY01_16040 [Levilactobacillus zymae]|uniref:Helix-turn-helix domain-containing protein n=1 Tax=Levilactobacillus zymae TaxID=267363 RepID=A0ABQ0WXD4_9LACO|nr:hypothetical protein [Levilactobacillus zymae]QFR61867.1 hypothetical protein LZ395_10160 [Levilactobacillus zymae]GEO72436.1 hypothetical protein LZY01_16040 [Levilactobacillus zymae]